MKQNLLGTLDIIMADPSEESAGVGASSAERAPSEGATPPQVGLRIRTIFDRIPVRIQPVTSLKSDPDPTCE